MPTLPLVRLLTILAMLFASFGMAAGHGAMAAPVAGPAAPHATLAADHCGGMDKPAKGHAGASADCAIACSALPSAAFEIAAHPACAAAVEPLPLASLHGLHPESDPPPPRFA